MQQVVLLLLVVASANAGLLLPYSGLVNSGIRSGPVHPAFGDLVATRRGLRPLSLEGFSEDDNMDGQVDPVGQAAIPAPVLPVAAYAAPVVRSAYTVAAPTVVRSAIIGSPLIF